MTELMKYLNEQLGVFLNKKQRQSASGRNKCICSSWQMLCYGCICSCVIHNFLPCMVEMPFVLVELQGLMSVNPNTEQPDHTEQHSWQRGPHPLYCLPPPFKFSAIPLPPFPVTSNLPVLFIWLKGWSCLIWCAILLSRVYTCQTLYLSTRFT